MDAPTHTPAARPTETERRGLLLLEIQELAERRQRLAGRFEPAPLVSACTVLGGLVGWLRVVALTDRDLDPGWLTLGLGALLGLALGMSLALGRALFLTRLGARLTALRQQLALLEDEA